VRAAAWARRLGVIAVVATGVTLLAGFGNTSRGAQTFTVDVDGHNAKVNEAFIAYYPSTVRVHAGDTVVFHEVGNGEPHTVTLGSLTNTVLSAFEKLTPKQLAGTPPKSFLRLDAKVPQLLPQGPGDAIQSGANPCFVTTGAPPAKSACPKVAQPEFTGKESFYNSGWLDSNAKFTVHLSSGIAPGTYRFMCLLHREGMTGKVVVVPSSTSVPSPSAQFAAGQKSLQATEAKLQPAATALAQGKPPLPVKLPGANPILAGSGTQSVQEAAITQFGPTKVHIPVGGSVTWYLIGPHSITFNSNKSNDDIRSVAPDGSVHLNPKALAPAGGPGEPPPKGGGGGGGGGSSNAPPTFKVVASTSWNGSGFLNSGVFVNSGPPLVEGYKLTFTKAGTYKYICTVHDDMKGEVDVG
jgi:plastocyanin